MKDSVKRGLAALAVVALLAAGSGAALAAAKKKKETAAPPPAGPAEEGRVAGIVEAHNRARASVPGLPPLAWDPALAASARKFADQEAASCKFDYDPDLPNDIGENSSYQDKQARPGEVVDQWAAEKSAYKGEAVNEKNYTKFAHYSQLMWRATSKVGCAVAPYDRHCPQNYPYGGYSEIWVCRYQPAGNVLGQKPY
jgi:hypothetical protein